MDRGIAVRVGLVVAALALPACDPGWHYEAPGGTSVQDEGLRYDVPGPPGVQVRTYASAFAGSLHAEVTLTSTGGRPLVLQSPRLAAVDARGVSLRELLPVKVTCPLHADALEIPPGAACTLRGRFQIRPLVRGIIFMRKNPDLARITLKVASSEAQAPTVTVPLVWME
jgi:hypothetical protein